MPKILGETNLHTREIPRNGSKAKDGEKIERNTSGTAGGPGGPDRTLAVESKVMPKYWVKNYFAHGRFPEVGQKQKTEEKERGAKVGDNNGQATHGARKHAWRTQAAWAKKKD